MDSISHMHWSSRWRSQGQDFSHGIPVTPGGLLAIEPHGERYPLFLSPLDSLSERLEQQVTGRKWELSGIANLVENAIPPFCSYLQCLTVPRSRRSAREGPNIPNFGCSPSYQTNALYAYYVSNTNLGWGCESAKGLLQRVQPQLEESEEFSI